MHTIGTVPYMHSTHRRHCTIEAFFPTCIAPIVSENYLLTEVLISCPLEHHSHLTKEARLAPFYSQEAQDHADRKQDSSSF